MSHPNEPARVRAARVEWLAERLSPRDWRIVRDVNRVRLMSSGQIERLHFGEVGESARGHTRRRTLARLVDWRVLTTLERRIGGVRAGSAGLIFVLDSGGERVLQLAPNATTERRVRRPGVPTELFVKHILAVTELYVLLTEGTRLAPGLELAAFNAEPGSWQPNGLGGWLKPDAYAALACKGVVDHWWIEVDRATEGLPTIRRQLGAYVDFVNRGQLGPDGVVPRVLVSVPDQRRADAVRDVAAGLPEPATALVSVMQHHEAIDFMVDALIAA